ncbi:MAG: hypothetical protein DIZ80_10845 [endosymbiont of Galathealinum brachiosum]|uniref:Uncharacterized protein n=1 Tax=endosymbiont of Galathealinum brachiosum TaxID=2200906 RepID=A0A370DCZ5_9GAMM|nr:MAG: hypothetical protein DIZ80_10845 [endosymbiont of Galathealinum brachiosum]
MEITTTILLLGFVGALVMGFVAHKTNYCTMGGVSDWINMGNTARLSAWFFSIAIAVFGVLFLQSFNDVSVESTLPPFLTANFAWLRYIVGGLMFGIGMVLAGGCGNKTLVNIGGGSLRSLFVLLIASIMAYLMTKTSFYEMFFHSWVSATSINLADFEIQNQSIDHLISALTGMEPSTSIHNIVGALLGATFLYLALRSKHFRKNRQLMAGAGIIGLMIVMAWYVTGGSMGQEAIETVEWLDERPVGVGVQSYTFINPMGDTLAYLMDPGNLLLISFGVVALLGVILGSLIYSLIAGKFRISAFSSKEDFIKHLIGGILMGVGGVLGMGCTIGQGITGVSTLAFGSLLVLGSIIFSAALTIKITYYKMAYEEEASFIGAFISTLVDFKCLPESVRRLEEP